MYVLFLFLEAVRAVGEAWFRASVWWDRGDARDRLHVPETSLLSQGQLE